MGIKERGLRVDGNDHRGLRHGRDRHVGFSFESEYYQPMPMFFSAEGNSFPGLMGNYRGASAFLVCSGPSFAALDHEPLKKCFTFGVNNSVKTFRPNAWGCVDDPARFLKSIWLDPTIMKFVPFDHAEKPFWDNTKENWGPMINKATGQNYKVRECPNMVYFRRNEKFEASRWLWEYTINWGNHSRYGGGRSIMLASLRILFILGFRNVYLLGCDLNMDGDSHYHFDQDRTTSAQRGNMSTYKKMTEEYYPSLKKEFDKVGYNVYNCNPDSKLKVFPHVSYEDALQRALGPLSIDTEVSQGMYVKYSDKMKEMSKIKNEFKLEKEAEKKKENPTPQKVEEPSPKMEIPVASTSIANTPRELTDADKKSIEETKKMVEEKRKIIEEAKRKEEARKLEEHKLKVQERIDAAQNQK